MFWNHFQEERIRKAYYDSLATAVDRLEEGGISFLPAAYCTFAYDDIRLVKRCGRAIRCLLKPYTIRQMIRLSEQFRQYTSVEWNIDWQKVSLKEIRDQFESEEDYTYALIAGSFHPNGYFREQCVGEMAAYPQTLPYMILRMNDWVGNVRNRAVKMIGEKLDRCPLDEIFPALITLDKVKRSERRGDRELASIEARIKERMEREMKDAPVYLILKYEFDIRKCIYRYLFSGKILEQEKADYLLARERHSYCQTVIISGILKDYDCSLEQIDRYLLHKSACVRRKAMDKKYDLLRDAWTGLETFLLDKNRGIRELAAFILGRHRDFDVPGYYICHLKDEKPETAITGLAETGSRDHAKMIIPFLTNPDETVVKAAVGALGRLMKEEGESLFWTYLSDPRIPVSKAAYQAVRSSRIRYGAEKLYGCWKMSGESHVKRYLIRLLILENTWNSLPYLLLLYQEPETEEIRGSILAALHCRSLYTYITKEQGQFITQLLDEVGGGLPGKLADEIRFDLKFIVKG
ncbi:hypothetical protein GPL15_18235 [Clostridium sp. MCC353]|uniref:HEAT repeat domain-containing protein n=1 Tax=Clostridium sp. MCC353 TaxID=2592646 RepID=UPI001C036246|nr:HEAT repeat domain-containing protein [Clostridium sp. MCC353]MBT9778440.1 hypothetical protein [Clostridium sp. MCC353]